MEGAVKIDIPAGQDNRGLYGCLAGNSGEDLGERVRGKVIVLKAEDCDGWGDEGVCMSGKEIVCVSKPVQGLVKKNDSSVVKLRVVLFFILGV